MTEQEFKKYFDTPAGQADYFEFIYDNHAGLMGNEDAILEVMESDHCYDCFMESMVTE